MTDYIFLDIETGPNHDVIFTMPDPKVSAPKNYKDPEKIKEYEQKALEEAKQKILDTASLDVDLGKIKAVGIKMGLKGKTHAWVVDEKFTEEKLLKLLWKSIEIVGGRMVGFNIMGFDIPFIMRRSLALEIKPSLIPDVRKYSNFPILDLMQVLSHNGLLRYRGLDFYCHRYGIIDKMPEITGADFNTLTPSMQKDYVREDVEKTARLFERIKDYYDVGLYRLNDLPTDLLNFLDKDS